MSLIGCSNEMDNWPDDDELDPALYDDGDEPDDFDPLAPWELLP